jgi:nicotinate-nucleotide adenylyltransferase
MKVGVLGGTFDPIHLGHLHLARHTQRLFELSQVYFVVACTPPHKCTKTIIPFSHRFAMVSLATAGQRSFVPSLIELEPPESPFTIHTLGKLARCDGRRARDLYFIAGEDSLLDVSNWRQSEKLLTSYNFVFASRPAVEHADALAVLPPGAVSHLRDLRGLAPREVRRRIKLEEQTSENRIFMIDVAALDISATRIRALASAGKRIDRLVPPSVHEYIKKQSIYGEP